MCINQDQFLNNVNKTEPRTDPELNQAKPKLRLNTFEARPGSKLNPD